MLFRQQRVWLTCLLYVPNMSDFISENLSDLLENVLQAFLLQVVGAKQEKNLKEIGKVLISKENSTAS